MACSEGESNSENLMALIPIYHIANYISERIIIGIAFSL